MKDHMKKLFKILLAASLAFVACEKPETPAPPQEDPIVVEPPICTYEYDGKEYPVYSVTYIEDDTQMLIKISPIKDDEKQSTYAVIGINSSLEGVEIDVAKAWHNDDYYFIYEDPVMYYSQYRQLVSGTIMLKKAGSGGYRVVADVVLPDGKTFKFAHIVDFFDE